MEKSIVYLTNVSYSLAAMSPPFDWHKDVDFWQFSHSVIEADLDTSLQKLLDLR